MLRWLRLPKVIPLLEQCGNNAWLVTPEASGTKYGVRTLKAKKTVAHNDVTFRGNGTEVVKENQSFVNANRINSANLNATTMKLVEKLDHPFSHFFIFGQHIYLRSRYRLCEGHKLHSDSKYFVSIH